MTDRYTPRERIEMIIAGERPDRFAASFWRHFFQMEHHAEGLAEAMLGFQEQFRWDFMKINPRADYHVQDWGVKLDYSHDEFTKHGKSSFPIKSSDDWLNIKPLAPTEGVFAEHLKAVAMIRKKSDPALPLLMTLFTPLAVAGRLAPDQQMLVEHIRSVPDKVEVALQAITTTLAAFASELRNAGADGLFYATTQWASQDALTWDEYERFGVPYDLKVVKAAEGDAINLLHVCASNNYLTEISAIDYHSQLYNWDSGDPTNLPLDRAYDLLSDKRLVGGIDHKGWLQSATPEELRR
ncbi:MAG: uroporphyrinogen decarboxylase family protein, partial [Candidatus Zixiibacteriota bacterium]